MQFWKTKPRTTGDEYDRAVSKTSVDWQSEIQRLSDELDALNVERAALVTEGGRAALDQQHARAADVAEQLVKLDVRERMIRSGLASAEDRQQDAERDEARRRLSLRIRAHLAQLPPFLEAHAAVLEAEAALSTAVVARSATIRDRVAFGDATTDLQREAPVPSIPDVVSGKSPDELRAEAVRLGHLAERATVNENGEIVETDEVIDADAIPLTDRQRTVQAIEAGQPDMERRRRLGVLEAQISDARNHEANLKADRTAHRVDRERAATRLVELEQQRAALVEEVEVPA